MKNRIMNAFNKSSETYDAFDSVQRGSSYYLCNMCSCIPKIESVLDIGCGTGNTTLIMKNIYKSANYTLCDISEKMINKAFEKIGSDAGYIICDAEKYDFTKKYSICISNLSLQWLDDLSAFLKKISLNCDYIAFSTLLDTSFENYSKIFTELQIPDPTYDYPTYCELLDICNNFGTIIKYDTKQYLLEFKNGMQVAQYFKKIGASTPSHGKMTSQIIKYNRKITLNYDVCFFLIKA